MKKTNCNICNQILVRIKNYQARIYNRNEYWFKFMSKRKQEKKESVFGKITLVGEHCKLKMGCSRGKQVWDQLWESGRESDSTRLQGNSPGTRRPLDPWYCHFFRCLDIHVYTPQISYMKYSFVTIWTWQSCVIHKSGLPLICCHWLLSFVV